jgi:hypothetical protein
MGAHAERGITQLSWVPRRGLEPPRLAAQPPQDCVYTSFTTWAFFKEQKLNLRSRLDYTYIKLNFKVLSLGCRGEDLNLHVCKDTRS